MIRTIAACSRKSHPLKDFLETLAMQSINSLRASPFGGKCSMKSASSEHELVLAINLEGKTLVDDRKYARGAAAGEDVIGLD